LKYGEKQVPAPDGTPGKRQRIIDRLEINTHDKVHALALLGEYMGMFPRGSAPKQRPRQRPDLEVRRDRIR